MTLNLSKSLAYLFVLSAILCSCKSSQPLSEELETFSLIVLLASERASLDNVEILTGETITKQKRTSRSQNQWLIELSKKPSEIESLIQALKEDKQVSSVELTQIPGN